MPEVIGSEVMKWEECVKSQCRWMIGGFLLCLGADIYPRSPTNGMMTQAEFEQGKMTRTRKIKDVLQPIVDTNKNVT